MKISKIVQTLQKFRLRYIWKNVTSKTKDTLHSTCDSTRIETEF